MSYFASTYFGGLQAGASVVVVAGTISQPVVIGDAYLAANSRAFEWTIAAPTGLYASDCTSVFRLWHPLRKSSMEVAGTVSNNGDGTWKLSHDATIEDTNKLLEGCHQFVVSLLASGVVITSFNGENVEVVPSRKAA